MQKMQLWTGLLSSVEPGLNYFMDHMVLFKHDSKARPFKQVMEVFKFASLFHPVVGKKLATANGFVLRTLFTEEVCRVLKVISPSIQAELE